MEKQAKTTKNKRTPGESGAKSDPTNLKTNRTNQTISDKHVQLASIFKEMSLTPVLTRRVVDLRRDVPAHRGHVRTTHTRQDEVEHVKTEVRSKVHLCEEAVLSELIESDDNEPAHDNHSVRQPVQQKPRSIRISRLAHYLSKFLVDANERIEITCALVQSTQCVRRKRTNGKGGARKRVYGHSPNPLRNKITRLTY